MKNSSNKKAVLCYPIYPNDYPTQLIEIVREDKATFDIRAYSCPTAKIITVDKKFVIVHDQI